MRKLLLVTGGAGFIGSNFCNSFVTSKERHAEYQLVILDLLTYAGSKTNIETALNEGAKLIVGDIRDKTLITDLFEEINFSGVIHFAAESHVDRSISGPDVFLETNVNGTVNLLNASLKAWRRNPQFRFLQISTDEVYGSLKKDDPAFTEEHRLAPNSPYSSSKASADLFVRAYNKTYGLPTLTTRCSNNYGPLQNHEKLIPHMISQAMKESPLPVYGDGSNIRDWIHVDDHNQGVWDVFTQGRPGEVYNLGGASEKTNLEIVRLILKKLGKKESLIQFVKDRPGHDFRYSIDFSKAQTQLKWKPKISFEKGLGDTIDWYRSRS